MATDILGPVGRILRTGTGTVFASIGTGLMCNSFNIM